MIVPSVKTLEQNNPVGWNGILAKLFIVTPLKDQKRRGYNKLYYCKQQLNPHIHKIDAADLRVMFEPGMCPEQFFLVIDVRNCQ